MSVRARLAGRDTSVVLARMVSLVVGPVTVLCVGLFLSPVVQGYYYSFGAVLSAALLFEAGISTAVVQIAAHEAARLDVRPSGVRGDGDALVRLAGVFRFALRWYWGIAVLLVAVVSIVGWILFSAQDDEVAWRLPWVLLVCAAAADFALQPFFVLLEGTGQVTRVYRYRMLRSIVQSLVVIAAVTAGLGLLALALGTSAAVAVGVLRLLPARRLFLDLAASRRAGGLRWIRDILPFQWRIAVSWAAGYCSVAVFTPLLLATQGPVAAGRMGMAVSLVTACTSLAASPAVANAPEMGRLAGGGEREGLKRLFAAKARQSIGFGALLLAVGVGVIAAAQALDVPVAHRVLDARAAAVLALGFLAYHVEGVLAFFMRAHRQEPYFVIELVGALLILPAALVVSRPAGALGVAAVFAAVHLLVLLPAAIAIFRRSFRGPDRPRRRRFARADLPVMTES